MYVSSRKHTHIYIYIGGLAWLGLAWLSSTADSKSSYEATRPSPNSQHFHPTRRGIQKKAGRRPALKSAGKHQIRRAIMKPQGEARIPNTSIQQEVVLKRKLAEGQLQKVRASIRSEEQS